MKAVLVAALLVGTLLTPAIAEARVRNCQDFEVTGPLEYVHCKLGICAGAVHGRAYAAEFSVQVSGWRLREGQQVTVTACVAKDLSVSRVRVTKAK